jgi:predicted nicotinamide N-methyase
MLAAPAADLQMRDEQERASFVRAQTRLTPIPLVPEISIHAAGELTPIWSATQTTLDLNDLEPPYWAFPWAGGQALARFVLDHPETVRGRRVFDFATGSGMIAIAACRAGAREVLAADIDPFACTAARLNMKSAGVRFEVSERDWVGDPLDGFDVVLVGDMFYERGPAERFDRWFNDLAAARREILAGDANRAYLPPGLECLARYDVPVSFDLESMEKRPTAVYRYPVKTV